MVLRAFVLAQTRLLSRRRTMSSIEKFLQKTLDTTGGPAQRAEIGYLTDFEPQLGRLP